MSSVPEEIAPMAMPIGEGLRKAAEACLKASTVSGERRFKYGGGNYVLYCPTPTEDPQNHQYMGEIQGEKQTCGLYLIIG